MTIAAHHPRIRAHWGFGSIVSMMLCLGAYTAIALFSGYPILLLVPLAVATWTWLAHSRSRVAAMMSADPAHPSRHAQLLHFVQAASTRLQVRLPDVYVSSEPMNNAFALADAKGGSLFFFESTLALLAEDELAAVVAHEVAHLKNRDSHYTNVLQAIRVSLTMLLAVFAVVVTFAWIVVAAFFRLFRGTENLFAFLAGGVAVLGAVVTNLLTFAGMRSRELSADRTAAQILPDPLALGRALRRLEASERRWQIGDVPAGVAALCIVQPFVPGFLSRLVSTHPPLDRRVRRLEKLVGPELTREANRAAALREWERHALALSSRLENVCEAAPRPIDSIVPFEPRKGEMVWTTARARLAKPRTKQGSLYFELAGSGTVYVTTHRLLFADESGRTEWLWSKVHTSTWKRGVQGGDALVLGVTNRQRPSGVYLSAADAAQVEHHVRLAMADMAGERELLVAEARDALREHLDRRPVAQEAADPRGSMQLRS